METAWKTLTGIGLVLIAMTGLSSCAGGDNIVGPTRFSVTAPTGPITMLVGQISGITVDLVVNGIPEPPTFRSSNTTVATVDAAGVVHCVTPGTATITVTGNGGTRTVEVTCNAAFLIDITPTTVPFTHSVGITTCPQRVGTLHITNVYLSVVGVTLTSSNPSLTLSAARADVPANGFVDIDVSFDCSAQAGFTASVSVGANNGGATQTKSVTIQATIDF